MSDPFEPRALPGAHVDSAVKVFDVVDPTAAREGFDSTQAGMSPGAFLKRALSRFLGAGVRT